MRFNLRTLFVSTAAVAIGCYFLTVAFGRYADFVALLAGASVLATLVGAGLGLVFGIRRRPRMRVAIAVAVVAGFASSFSVMQAEWHDGGPNPGHLWPASDVLYVALAIFRCGLLGGAIGYVVLAAFTVLAAGPAEGAASEKGSPGPDATATLKTDGTAVLRANDPVARAKRLLPAGVYIVALALSWWPYWSYHQEDRAVRRLLTAVQTANIQRVREKVVSVKRYHDGAGAISRVAFLAANGQNERVRMAALEGLKSLGDIALEAPLLRPLLGEIVRDDPSADVRAAAASWLAAIDAEPR